MSVGGSIPYHLRQNKAIERNLFVDLLSRVGRYFNVSEFQYIGFGGPFLEDFKHLHSALRISSMISIEMDDNVFSRQGFNKPISCISLRKETSAEFLSKYPLDDDKNRIVWFDYATTEIGAQLAELQVLVERLGHGDIFKITVNAAPGSLGHADAGENIHVMRARKAAALFGDYATDEILPDDVRTRNYPKLLLKTLLNSAKHGVSGDSSLIVQPLTSFVYSDGQQMLTFCGILLNESEVDDFFDKSRLNLWPFFNDCSVSPRSISVPALSAKERVYIESMLPGVGAADIMHELKYYVGSDAKSGLNEMANFIEFYRLFPWYSRIVL